MIWTALTWLSSAGHIGKGTPCVQRCGNKAWAACQLVKAKLMHMEVNSDPPPVIIGSESIEFVTSFVYLGSEIFRLSRRSAEDLGWLQMSWEASWDHYGGVMTSDIPSYEVTMPPTSLCYYTTLRRGLSARPSPPATIDLSSMSSGPSKLCTGLILCWMRISAGGADDRASSKTLVSNIFASFVISCENDHPTRIIY